MGALEIAAVLTPLLAPFARRAAGEARDRLADRVGREGAEALGGLWERLRDRLTGSDDTPPADADSGLARDEQALQQQIARLLAEDPALMRDAEATAIMVSGDHNVIQQGETNINVSGGQDIRIGRL